MCRAHSFVARTRAASLLPKIQCLSVMRTRERLRWLVLRRSFSISVVTQKGLSLNLSDNVGSEEVFACFSGLRLCSIVLRLYAAAIPSSPRISRLFRIALALFAHSVLHDCPLQNWKNSPYTHLSSSVARLQRFTLPQSGDVAMDTSYSSSYGTVLVRLRVQTRRNCEVSCLECGFPSTLMIRSK